VRKISSNVLTLLIVKSFSVLSNFELPFFCQKSKNSVKCHYFQKHSENLYSSGTENNFVNKKNYQNLEIFRMRRFLFVLISKRLKLRKLKIGKISDLECFFFAGNKIGLEGANIVTRSFLTICLNY